MIYDILKCQFIANDDWITFMKKIMPIIAAVMLVLSLAFWAASADEPMDVRLVDAPAEEGSQTGTGA